MSSTSYDGTGDLYFSSDGKVFDSTGNQVGIYHADDHGAVDVVSVDTNADGRTDLAVMDTDHNGTFETGEADTNYDGHADTLILDTDHDGNPDHAVPDANADGVPDADAGVPDHAAV